MGSIFLVRHGQASFGADDYDQLSEVGVKQACRLGQELQRRFSSIDAVVHGDMRRHLQTMHYCMQEFIQLKFEPILHAGWREYDHQHILGQFNSVLATPKSIHQHLAQFDNPQQVFRQYFTDAISHWINGERDYDESWQQFTQRVEHAWLQLQDVAKDKKRVLVFTSGGPIAFICLQLLGLSHQQFLRVNWMLNNCGVTKVVMSKQGPVLSTFNEHSWFEGEFQHLISYR
ncbi:histidine phosphatase family protein [Neptunicella marina]|uniref:Histidine phosphatase family protein n=1 Tax=Neptunicella marina TaxID=2125989 RepID=A0A8J6IZ80_9ALTE|nr:histidine phosphatase family protein [Neptunicella marina]MBC3767428.1 histidine phosphatase family protein [Neptunicella marina]